MAGVVFRYRGQVTQSQHADDVGVFFNLNDTNQWAESPTGDG